MIADLLLEAFFGAVTGYVTNDIAIKTLFKPGGTVEKTRERFTEEIAALLESEIITPEALAEILSRPEVEQALNKIISALLIDLIPSMLNDTINDLDGGSLNRFLAEKTISLSNQQAFEEALRTALSKSFTPELAADFLNLLQHLLSVLAQKEPVTAFEPHTILLDRSCSADTEAAITQLTIRLSENLLANDPNLVRKAVQALQLPQILAHFKDALGACSLSDYCSLEPADPASWQDFFASAHGRFLISEAVLAFSQSLKRCPLSVSQFFSLPPVKEMLLPLIEQQWPAVSRLLLQWLSHNKPLLVSLINEAVGEALGTQESIAPLINKLLKEFLGSEDEFSTEFFRQAQDFLADALTAEQLYTHLSSPSSPWGEYKIAALAAHISPNRAENILQALLPDILASNEAVNSFFRMPLAKLFGKHPDLFRRVSEQVLAKCSRPEFISLVLNRLLLTELQALYTIPIAQKYPHCHQEILSFIENFPILNKPELLAPKLSAFMAKLLSAKLPLLGEYLTKLPLKQIYTAYFTPQKVQELLPVLNKHCHAFLLAAVPGRLAPLAQKSLDSLSNEDLRRLVEDFMGKELKPLNYLGAIMGAGAGAAVGTVSGLALVDPFNPYFFASKLGVFGAVGYSTNCGAIKGLFWPYKPLFHLHSLQGIIPKRQGEFSHSLGHLFERYVLNPASLASLLHVEQKAICASVQKTIFTVECELLKKAASETGKSSVSSFLTAYLAQINGQTLQKAFFPISGTPLSVADASFLIPYYPQILSAYLEHLPRQLSAFADSLIFTENISLKSFISSNELASFIKPDYKLSDEWLLALAQKTAADTAHIFSQRIDKLFSEPVSKLEPHIAKFLPLILDMLCQYLLRHADELIALLQKAVKNRLNMLQTFAYAAMNGDQLIAAVLRIFLEQKLPYFCRLKADELTKASTAYLEHFCADSLQNNGLVVTADVLYMLFSAKEVRESSALLLSAIAEKLLAQPLASLLAQPPLAEPLKEAKQELLSALPAALDIIKSPLMSALAQSDIEQLAHSLKFTAEFQRDLAHYWQRILVILRQETADIPLAQLLPSFKNSSFLTDFGDNLLSAPFMQEHLKANLTYPEQLQDYLKALSVALGTLSTDIILAACPLYGRLLEQMRLAEFITEKTAALSPQSLENTVRSFAQSYFSHIQNMGWWGAVFAIPGMLLALLL